MKIQRYYTEFEERTQHPGSRALHYFFIPVFFFAVMGLIWMIPFPEIAFLKKHGYHIFLNWGSFFIAIVIYYYLRLAPTISYAVLFSIGVMSFVIVQLEYVEQRGGPAVWMICTVLLILSVALLWISGNKSGRGSQTLRGFMCLHAHGPLWLWHLIFEKYQIRH